jgi:hypothetical protein
MMVALLIRCGAEGVKRLYFRAQNGFWSAGMMVGDFTAGPIYELLCSARTCFAFCAPPAHAPRP